MARYKLNSGQIVQGDMEVQVNFPVTREVTPAEFDEEGSLVTPAEIVTADEPMTVAGVARLTAEERASLGIVEIVEEQPPDSRYGFVSEDPENPGMWIVTPFPDEMLKQRLSAYAANVRFTKETSGVVLNGVTIATDRGSQSMISGAFSYAQMNPLATVNWKQPDGSFVTLDGAQIMAIAQAVAAHVQACFSTEATVTAEIAAGTIATYEGIDEAFAA